MSRLIRRLPSLFKTYNLKALASYKYSSNSANDNNNKSFFVVQDQSKLNNTNSLKNELIYEKISNETLESLAEQFDELGENELSEEDAKHYDVSYSNGVLTVKFPPTIGTYVLNKQTPNLQIWLSSPMSGPKRFDLDENKNWIYKRTGESLYELLNNEISKCIGKSVRFD